MKSKYQTINLILIFSLSVFLFQACGEKEEPKLEINPNFKHTAKIIEIIDATQYTYLKVEENKNQFWIAVPQINIAIGTIIYFNDGLEMKDFTSQSLNRTFDSILFIDNIEVHGDTPVMENPHAGVQGNKVPNISVEPLNGLSIEKIYSTKNELNGKTISVRGIVTKFNSGIMDRNWIHIQDGSGKANDFDLLITSNETVKEGDLITFEGKVILDRDFGSGYFYSLLLEDGKIKK